MAAPKVFDLDRFMQLWLTPRTDQEIADQFGVTKPTVANWRQKHRAEIQGKMQEWALAENLRLTPLAMKKMGELLKSGNVEVLKMHFKLLGVAEQLEQRGGDTQIMVVLPSGVQMPEQKVIEVKGEVVDADQ